MCFPTLFRAIRSWACPGTKPENTVNTVTSSVYKALACSLSSCVGLKPLGPQRRTRMQVSEATKTFLTGYFATCRRSTKTRAAYEIDLAQLTAYLGPDKPLEAVEPENMENWAQDMKNRGFASVTIRRKFATARVFFAYWVRRKCITKSPLWEIRLARISHRTGS